MEIQTLKELEAKPRNRTTESKILQQRAKVSSMRLGGAISEPEPHITLFARFTGLDPETVRLALLIVLSLLIEAGAAITLFAAVGHVTNSTIPTLRLPPTESRDTEY
jgi:hypothetical protein